MPQLKPSEDELYTYADYLTWGNAERWELIYGQASCMSTSPMQQHQKLSVVFTSVIYNHFGT